MSPPTKTVNQASKWRMEVKETWRGAARFDSIVNISRRSVEAPGHSGNKQLVVESKSAAAGEVDRLIYQIDRSYRRVARRRRDGVGAAQVAAHESVHDVNGEQHDLHLPHHDGVHVRLAPAQGSRSDERAVRTLFAHCPIYCIRCGHRLAARLQAGVPTRSAIRAACSWPCTSGTRWACCPRATG